ncbi:NAD(P)-dependent dehydrogenase (short-subunit alcohol dehydrogenase family)/2-polyprenyl-6-methoxyphenol hydroxylase-like FAD-dependent oxidoreductase [Amycolatopsis lexingtonensis]|uniref:NAD(P)-dependent dehydrogenase (Short-subunit alcohol dehydrogenase family)/2-polyprenyl-6-methoxyphenol hydroxylase-like FAD-dependent oxidoreductase n=1 Tax=Amycolatopsis lexingtonensis TaxID=218822 RepID=A0ABR9I0U6_9PSEU|nr:NAD(P)-dependent dehydrogenase (short-subunit alcohol dehydrogenase family)/2-polyprenyl-6-methoxyphenol hydroxylase-like FAD-dependent oxidoreductase [Amycolatopsis lexingtonensis]
MTRPEAADVLVVGAGPAGLLLAHDLSAAGVAVTVLEQRTAPHTESRASTLHARTMELFAERGLLDELGPPSRGGAGHFGGLGLDLAEADPAHPYAGQWKAPQTEVEAVLARRAVARGADLRRGHRVTALTEHGTHVEVTAIGPAGPVRWRAAFVAGCDGEDSTVRRLAGIGFPGHDAQRELLRADVRGIDVPDRRFERRPAGLAIASRGPDGTTRLMVHEYGRAPRTSPGEPGFAEFAEVWRHVTGEDVSHGEALWVNAFGDVRRQAERYRAGRIVLAGDAAHAQLPVGGQAINLGLQDAAELAPRLAAQFTGEPDEALLAGYHDVRHAVGRRALAGIEAQANLLLGGPEVEALREVVGELLELGPVRRHLAAAISSLDTPRPAARPGAGPTTPRRTEMAQLSGKTALVTGSSRGIGRATAERLARAGALVAVHYAENEAAAAEVVAAIEGDGGRAFAVGADLAAPGGVHELFLALELGLKERTGSTDLDILVNNAGVMGGVAPEDITPEQFDRLYAVNAKAPFFLVQRALRNLPDGGRIVNISSGLTRFANPQEVAYAMTKGAVDQLTLHFAKHLGPRGITVNSVGPGITDNGSPVFRNAEAVAQMASLSAFGRVGETDDVAAVVEFLAGPGARWITGSYVDASGGTLLGG